MATTLTAPSKPDLLLQSSEATWNRERWEMIGDDGNRYEVIDGVLYMSTAPRPVHQLVSRLAQRQLYLQIDDRGLGITLDAPIGLFMPGCDPVQPDLLVIRTEDLEMIRADGIEGIPALVVEILSPSTRNYDLVVKRAVYARAGVPEHWIFRPRERDVLIHTNPDLSSGQYLQVTHISPDGELISPTLPFRAPVAAFFPDFPVGSSLNAEQTLALNQLPPLGDRRTALERLGETVKDILASTGMTEDELVDALTRDDWHSSGDDADNEAKGTDASRCSA